MIVSVRNSVSWVGRGTIMARMGVLFRAADYLVFAIWPKLKDDRDAPASFWEKALGDDAERIKDGDFLRGFGEGAIEVWNEVSNEL